MGLDVVELMMSVEDSFRILIADEEAETVRTVGDLYDLVARKVESDTDLWPTLQAIVADKFGVPVERIERSTDFIRDLGA